MKLNSRGQVMYGLDRVVSVASSPTDSRIVAGVMDVLHCGGGGWVDDDTIIYQVNDAGAYLETYNIVTKKRTKVSERGANFIIAGGGRWAAWLHKEAGSIYGVYGEFRSVLGNVGGAGRDGSMVIFRNAEDASGAVLYAPDGRATELPDDPDRIGMVGPGYSEIIVLGPTSAIWLTKHLQFAALNAPVPVQAGPACNISLSKVNGEDWIVYWTEEIGLITHPVNSLEGYILVSVKSAANAFWPDSVGYNGKLRVAYSARQGERPEDLRMMDVDLSLPRTNFARGSVVPVTAPAFTEQSTGGIASTANASFLVQPQLGLLEDDIVYRLALLATNVLQPLKNQYPNIVIKSGFRQVNSAAGQHEMGEAVDLQIVNQTPALLYEVADWIQKNLAFDQLVLNFTNIGDGQPWIHVSFSPTSLRGQVFTKDFADTFHEGLYLVQELTGEDAASALREQAALDARIFTEMEKIMKRANKLYPTTSVTDDLMGVSSGIGTTISVGTRGTGGNDLLRRGRLVACVKDALGLTGRTEADHTRNAFDIAKRVAWLLRDEGCGLLLGPAGGEHVVNDGGYDYRAGRVCYPDGQVYKLLTDIEGGTHTPGWEDEGMVEPSLFTPAVDPGANINLNWLQCPLPTRTTPENTVRERG